MLKASLAGAAVTFALIAVPVIAAVQDLPLSFTLLIGALALLPTFKVITRKSLQGSMPVPVKAGAITALIVAAMPFQAAGMPMAFWALLAGVLVSVALEHGLMWQTWRPGRTAANFC